MSHCLDLNKFLSGSFVAVLAPSCPVLMCSAEGKTCTQV